MAADVSVLLDTSVLIGVEQQRAVGPVPPDAVLSVMTLEELWLGVLQAEPDLRALRQQTYRQAANAFAALPVDVSVARTSADIRAEGRRRGRRYGLADSLIAATARLHAVPLYTQDEGMLGMLGVDVRVV